MEKSYALLAAGAALLALASTPLVGALARRIGALDAARETKERGPIPRLGGLAVLLSALGTLAAAQALGLDVVSLLRAHGWNVGWFVAGGLIVLAVGGVDDVRRVRPAGKLLAQVLAGCMVLAGGYGFQLVTNPLTGGYLDLAPFGGLATLLWVVGITNAFNLIDGLDGLAAGVAAIACATLFVIALVEERPDAAVLSATLAGALAGFLRFNFSPASIFLGDSGSLLLGYVLSVLSIQSLQKGATAVVIVVPILALGFPIIETVVTIVRRALIEGLASLFRADREHIHDRLLRLGMTQRRAVLLLYGVCAVFGMLAFLSVTVWRVSNAALLAVVALLTFAGVRRLGYRRR